MVDNSNRLDSDTNSLYHSAVDKQSHGRILINHGSVLALYMAISISKRKQILSSRIGLKYSSWVKQFMQGLPDGPVPFHYPAQDYGCDLIGG